MKLFLKFVVLSLALFVFVSCNNKEPEAGENSRTGIAEKKDSGKYTLTFNLPFESTNYDTVINFYLKDASGKLCVASLDTVTKGGGTVAYDSLPEGVYTYTIKTVLNETLSKEINLDSSVYVNLYDDIYNVVDAIELDSLVITDTIKIMIRDTGRSELYIIRKMKNRYEIDCNEPDKKNSPKKYDRDSAVVIDAIIELQAFALGLQRIGVFDEDAYSEYGYWGENFIYIRSGKQFLEIHALRADHMKRMRKKFQQAIVK